MRIDEGFNPITGPEEAVRAELARLAQERELIAKQVASNKPPTDPKEVPR